MGCDIHITLEYKNREGEWKRTPHSIANVGTFDGFYESPVWNDEEVVEAVKWSPELSSAAWANLVRHTARSYRMFRRIAGVRGEHDKTRHLHGRGRTGVGPHPQGRYTDDDYGLHSHSYATVKELLEDIDWDESYEYEDYASKTVVKLSDCDFYQWLTGPEITTLTDMVGGADNLRVVYAFDN